jgi:competence ComEA-like helix-hairpin-helix protein
MSDSPDGIWTVRQRRGLIALLAVITALLTLRLLMNRLTIPDPQPALAPAADQLQDRIDPNIATAAQLAAIPGVGETRAEAIVAFRESYAKEHPQHRPFNNFFDLQLVPGIGESTSESMDPYLLFPQVSTTAP